MNIRQAVLAAGVMQQGHFIFADGAHALVKLEMDNLWQHPAELSVILDALGRAEGLPEADVVIGVPTGGQRLAIELVQSRRVKAPIALLERVPGGKKQDFRFVNAEDERLAREAKSVRIYEDVVTTLSSVAGVVELLNSDSQDIHVLAIWRRGKVKPEYALGVTGHYLVEEEIEMFTPESCPHEHI